ncbi:MAG: transcription termination/antitermination protein NusA [Deltaproteobacteria bacterium]|nr:transcription termination/antitermination protein NusA [Deltaproteobacteria bacterium]
MAPSLDYVIEQVQREKGISRDVIVDAIETAILTAVRKKMGQDLDLEAQYNPETGEIEVFQFRTVVEEVENPDTEISLEEARRELDEESEVGDSIGVKIDTSDLGRIAAQTAKQVIMQKVRDAELESIYEQYKDRKGDLISGTVQRIERGGHILVNLGKTEALLPLSEQIPNETFRRGERVRALIIDVRKETRGPQIILSRTHPGFLIRLFELEVPEIASGDVKIVNAVRDPGQRAKIAVYTKDSHIDPVGSCVGVRGSRVQNIVQELRGERIDIIPWTPDYTKFICSALAPAKISKVFIDEENRSIEVIVDDDQLSLAIGKKGQNVRLASKLTEWRIDIRSETELEETFKKAVADFMEKLDIGEVLARMLYNEGFVSVEEIAEVDIDELLEIEGLEEEKARWIHERAKAAVKASEAPEGGTLEEAEEKTSEKKGAAGSDLKALPGVGPKLFSQFVQSGIETVEKLASLSLEELMKVPGVGEKKAKALLESAKAALEQGDEA